MVFGAVRNVREWAIVLDESKGIALISIRLFDSGYIASRMTEVEREWRGEHTIMYLFETITERLINGCVKALQVSSLSFL